MSERESGSVSGKPTVLPNGDEVSTLLEAFQSGVNTGVAMRMDAEAENARCPHPASDADAEWFATFADFVRDVESIGGFKVPPHWERKLRNAATALRQGVTEEMVERVLRGHRNRNKDWNSPNINWRKQHALLLDEITAAINKGEKP